jgi:phosphoribulokinase
MGGVSAVPAKLMRMHRALGRRRPTMLAIAGDSAAGKTTLTRGLVQALGAQRSTSLCVDDYHRYDRAERKRLPFTPLHPDCNYMQIMEQHLQLLAMGEPILKPVYDHSTGQLTRPELVEPRDFVIAEGLLPLHTSLSRACFDVTVYVDPGEHIRREWKVRRDVRERGYSRAEVLAELERREPESAGFIRPQRREADIAVSFGPIDGRHDPPDTPLSVTLLLRPTIRHPNFAKLIAEVPPRVAHLKLMRDMDGSPADALHIHGYAPEGEAEVLAKAIWDGLDVEQPLPDCLGMIDETRRSEPLRLAQLLLLYHLMRDMA